MQTQARAKYSRPSSSDEHEYPAFAGMIQRDPDICNNCFRLTHVTYERNYVVDSIGDDTWVRAPLRKDGLPDRSYPVHRNTDYMEAEQDTKGTYLTCKCGSRHDSIRPVRKEVAMEYIERILNRLDEKNVDFHRDLLRRTAWKALGRPEWQGRQDDLFGELVEITVSDRSGQGH